MKQIINTNEAPTPIGPYNQAILIGNTLYTSGQIAIDPKTGEVTLSGKLNFDTREHYELEIVAVDGGEPSLSG